MKESTLNKKIAKLEAEREELFAIIMPLQDKNHKIYEELRILKEKQGKLVVERMKKEAPNFTPTRTKLLSDEELAFVLVAEHGSMPMHYYAEEIIKNRIDPGYNFKRSGYWPEINQTAFSISLDKGDAANTKMIHKAVTYFCKHLKPRTKDQYDRPVEKHYHSFSIMERTLSRYGSYHLHVYLDGTCAVVTRSEYNKQEFPNLKEALAYIEQNVWMEDKTPGGRRKYNDDDYDYGNEDD